MARPRLTDETFLSFLFKPSKNPKPTGLRKTALSGLQGGRRKARLTAFNKMPAEKQAVIRRSGSLEEYLRGQVTYTDAKRSLRSEAVSLGIVKPLPAAQRPIVHVQFASTRLTIAHLINELGHGKVNVPRTAKRLDKVSEAVKREVRRSDRETIRRRASGHDDQDWMIQADDGETFNPYWYN
jgi:hypothetical protein